MLGANPAGQGFVVGYGPNPPTRPHHRTAHGSWANDFDVPAENRHTLFGALVGGPDASGDYVDDRNDYVQNEVAVDYNAGLVGALARLVLEHGGAPLTDFPPAETPRGEFFVAAEIVSESTRHTEVTATVHNRSAWPAQTTSALAYRYFVDLSEVVDAGYTQDDVLVESVAWGAPGSGGDREGTLSGLLPWDVDRGLYYVEVAYEGVDIFPGGELAHRRQATFRLSLPVDDDVWDATNDPSRAGLPTATPDSTPLIPVYDSGVLLSGQEP